MRFLLINSASSNPFCAFFTPVPPLSERTPSEKGDRGMINGGFLTTSFVSDFFDKDLQTTSRRQDKLINCLYSLSKKFESDFHTIKAISVITGPGSFTGIRVGIAIAKGISLALDKKIIPVTNFELTLNRLPKIEPEKKYCVLIPGKKPEYYYSVIQNGKELSSGYMQIPPSPSFTPLDEVASGKRGPGGEAFVSDFDDESELKLNYFEIHNVGFMKSEPDSMLELTLKNYSEGNLFMPEKIEPLYIKDFQIKNF